MKPQPTHTFLDIQNEHSAFSESKNVLSLPGAALTEIMQAVFSKGKNFKFKAKGFSMSPFIRNGDVVTLSPKADAVPSLGDVVAFLPSGAQAVVIHRVVGKKDNQLFYLKGDNIPELDRPVLQTNILGFVSRVERMGEKVFWGLGPEKLLIALLSRRLILIPLLLAFWKFLGPLIGSKKHG